MYVSKKYFCIVILAFLAIQVVGQVDETPEDVEDGEPTDNRQPGSALNVFPPEGSVGIGVPNPFYPLEVNGVVRSKEMLVESHPWPDFVFEAEYTLPDLRDVERYIDENGHLEHIPSAAVVEKNGIAVGEMSARLLQKIEELTLYLIEQNKQIEALEKEVATLKISQQDPSFPEDQ